MKVQKSVKLAHTTSIFISLVINGLLLLALVTFITFQTGMERDASTVMVIDPVDQELIEELEEELLEEEIVEPEDLDDLLDFTMDTPMEAEFEPVTEVVEQSTTEVSSLSELMSDVSSPVVMTGLLQGRTPQARAAAMAKHGRGLEKFTEPSVMKALEWLRDHQQPNGSWNKAGTNGSGSNVGYTGLALLAFLAHGETPSSKEFGATVAKGIRYIVEGQDDKGVFRPAGGNVTYGHAIATYAIAEAYTMTNNILLREPLERGVEVIRRGMMPNGGFDYHYKKENRNDLSTGAWHVQALKAASLALSDDPEVKKTFQKAMDGMLFGSRKNSDGSRDFAYTVKNDGSRHEGRKTISAAGTLGLHLAGRAKSNEAKEALQYLEQYTASDTLPRWGNKDVGQDHGGEIMFWYYAVQAFFQEDDKDQKNFHRYMPSMVKALVQNQAEDGHWQCYTEHGAKIGEVVNTSLGALGLMVFYRYLPTTQADNIQEGGMPSAEPVFEEDEGDVGFKI